MSDKTSKVILYVNDSKESEKVRKLFEESGIEFSVRFQQGTSEEVPAVKVPLGIFRGYLNVLRYAIPKKVVPRAS